MSKYQLLLAKNDGKREVSKQIEPGSDAWIAISGEIARENLAFLTVF